MTFLEAERLAREFESCILPRRQWRHEAHFAVGLWYARLGEPAKALEKMRAGVGDYNRICGSPTAEDVPRKRGWHETLTRLHIAALCDFWQDFTARQTAADPEALFEAALASLIADPIAEKDYPLCFYSSEVLFSPEARYGFVSPDKTTFPPCALAHF